PGAVPRDTRPQHPGAAHRAQVPRAIRMTIPTAKQTQELVARSVRRRQWAEKRFRAYGMLAVLFGIAFVLFLFATLIGKGSSVFRQTYVQLDVFYDPAIVNP